MANLFAHSANLGTGLTTAGDTTNVLDRGNQHWNYPGLVKVVTTVGSTPTATYAIVGSVDGVNFYGLPYADSASLSTLTVATFVITTATTKFLFLQPAPWRYLKVTLSAVTNVTSTIDVYTGE